MIPGLGRSEVMIKFINDGSWDFSRQIRPETTQMIFMKSEGKTTYQQQASLAINLKFISSLRLNTTGWWLTYPSEKWWSSSVGMMTFPIYGKNVPNHQPNNIYWLRHRYSPRSINLSIPADGHAPLSSIVMAVPHSNGWVPKQPPCKSFSTPLPPFFGIKSLYKLQFQGVHWFSRMKNMVKTGLFCENNIEKRDPMVIGLVEGKNCKAVPKNERALQHVVSRDFPMA